MIAPNTPTVTPATYPGIERSASVLAATLVSLFPDTRSAVEVGGGGGVWLAQLRRLGIDDIHGYGGDENLTRDQLAIPQERFTRIDLLESPQPDRRYDLCLCMGAAAEVCAEESDRFVAFLCALSDTVVFSHALPGQLVNDVPSAQWPSFWSRVFARHGYGLLDVVRPRIWYDSRISWAYRQGTFVFVRKSGAEHHAPDCDWMLDVVHPEYYRIQSSALAEAQAIVNGAVQRDPDLETQLRVLEKRWRSRSALIKQLLGVLRKKKRAA